MNYETRAKRISNENNRYIGNWNKTEFAITAARTRLAETIGHTVFHQQPQQLAPSIEQIQ